MSEVPLQSENPDWVSLCIIKNGSNDGPWSSTRMIFFHPEQLFFVYRV